MSLTPHFHKTLYLIGSKFFLRAEPRYRDWDTGSSQSTLTRYLVCGELKHHPFPSPIKSQVVLEHDVAAKYLSPKVLCAPEAESSSWLQNNMQIGASKSAAIVTFGGLCGNRCLWEGTEGLPKMIWEYILDGDSVVLHQNWARSRSR